MLVYSPSGVAEEKENCDARECIKHCGYTTEPKEATKVAVVEQPVAQVVEPEAPKRGRPKAFFGKDESPATLSTVSSDVI